MESKKNIPPLKDKAVTSTAFFGDELSNGILVECIASFGNMMNYRNAQVQKIRMEAKEDGVPSTVIEPYNYEFTESKEYKLVFAQTMKIIVDGKETDKTKENFNKVLDREKKVFFNALTEILEKSDDVGFTISQLTTN
ncbi:hypothetical protein [uncultured Sneathia sp.]|uniref:hypothetical protein n=1 Tax=uncultured Sneathia sp. TaxID=278067 RepID=UPI00259B0578|nr:hypothetical protein [uncultured Sneathia sp.]